MKQSLCTIRLGSLALFLAVAIAAECPQSNNNPLDANCECRVAGGSFVECTAGKYCHNYHMGCHSSAGAKTCASDATLSCPANSKRVDAWLCDGTCTVEKCCAPTFECEMSDTNPLSKTCHCGSYYDPRSPGTCSDTKYCWSEHSFSYCTDSPKANYGEKTCGEGFRGTDNIVGSSTCPNGFEKRDADDQHRGRNMDYRQCCFAQCKTRLANCNQIDSTMNVADGWLMPNNQAGDISVSSCCYRTMCTAWEESGNLCPSGKVPRGPYDGHICENNICDTNQCCKDAPECDKDHKLWEPCYCGSASNICKKDQYCWSDGDTCKNEEPETDSDGCPKGSDSGVDKDKPDDYKEGFDKCCHTCTEGPEEGNCKSLLTFFGKDGCYQPCAIGWSDKHKDKMIEEYKCDSDQESEINTLLADPRGAACPSGTEQGVPLSETQKEEEGWSSDFKSCCHTCTKGPEDCKSYLTAISSGGCYASCAIGYTDEQIVKTSEHFKCSSKDAAEATTVVKDAKIAAAAGATATPASDNSTSLDELGGATATAAGNLLIAVVALIAVMVAMR